MHWILLALISGIVVGFLLRNRRTIIQSVDKLTSYIIYLLLFSLGISIGINPKILSHIDTFLYQSVILSWSGILGSAAVAFIVYKLFFEDKKIEK